MVKLNPEFNKLLTKAIQNFEPQIQKILRDQLNLIAKSSSWFYKGLLKLLNGDFQFTSEKMPYT